MKHPKKYCETLAKFLAVKMWVDWWGGIVGFTNAQQSSRFYPI